MANGKGKGKITVAVDKETGKLHARIPPGAKVREIPMADVTLAVKSEGAIVHHKIVHVPEFTVIHTKTNPICQWIFINGRWVQICI